MSGDYIFIPFPKDTYHHASLIIGKDPTQLIEEGVIGLIERKLESGDYLPPDEESLTEHIERWWTAAENINPSFVDAHRANADSSLSRVEKENRPLIWKEVTIPSGSNVRMTYDGSDHFAVVKEGKILDDGHLYSPSEWASKIANGTSRNAWRDLYFQIKGSRFFVPADLLRKQARQTMANALTLDASAREQID